MLDLSWSFSWWLEESRSAVRETPGVLTGKCGVSNLVHAVTNLLDDHWFSSG